MTARSTLIAELRQFRVLSDLSEEDLEWFAAQCELRTYQPDELIVQKGDPADHMVMILEGGMRARDESGGNDSWTFEARQGEIAGALPFSRLTTYNRSGRAVGLLRVAAFPKTLFPQLIERMPELGARLVQMMADRIRETASRDVQAEKLSALGKLSAGLAHELNNPAAAALRSAREMREALSSLLDANVRLDERPLTITQRGAIACAERETIEQLGTGVSLTPLERGDREDEVTAWLEKRGVARPWEIATALVEMDWTAADLDQFGAPFAPEDLSCVLRRITATITVGRLMAEIENSTQRISELVKAIKEYSFMDQGVEQEVDLHDGIEKTLVMLGFRLKKGVTVVKEFDRGLPRICAHGSALNQIWTNLIDNAVDAMNGTGEIRIRTAREYGMARVELEDNGPGIPPGVQGRIFEPFFTTKGMGQGSGLGLDVVRRIVEQHHGQIHVESRPGMTRFVIRLPLPKALGA